MAKQHVDMHRKLLLRRQLLPLAHGGGAVYVPFIGDGDIAVQCYAHLRVFGAGRRHLYGADIDPARVAVASTRRAGWTVKVADCDEWPFPGVDDPFAIADFDAYAHPYDSFRAFWQHAPKAPRVVLFFTANRKGVIRTGTWRPPEGGKVTGLPLAERRRIFNQYLAGHVYPWLERYVKPWRVLRKAGYVRDGEVYWGAVVQA